MLKFNSKIISGLIILSVLMLAVIGCDKGAENKKGVIAQMVDSVAVAVGEGFAESALINVAAVDTEVEMVGEINGPGAVGQIVIGTNHLYGLCDAGLVVYDFAENDYSLIQNESPLMAITEHEGSIYVGGTELYRLVDGRLVKQEDQFEGVISALYSFEYRLMVGTEVNLYSTGIFGNELLLEDVSVSAMVSGGGGLWVGTDGQGLYRWDGDQFKKRYLRRDTALFDTILTLDFNHNHLYAASVNGLHLFNGGNWTTYTATDGIPMGEITDIDASGWVVYIGSDSGVVSLYNDELKRVDGLEYESVNSLARQGMRLIFSTDAEGIIRQSGKNRKTLVPYQEEKEAEYLLSAG